MAREGTRVRSPCPEEEHERRARHTAEGEHREVLELRVKAEEDPTRKTWT